MRTLILAAMLVGIGALGACDGSAAAEKARKDQAKRARDVQLLALPYPATSGLDSKSLSVAYDGARDRTTTTLRLADLKTGGKSAQQIRAATLHLTSSHKGRERASDNPEGSVDGSLTVNSSQAGVLAYSGPPGEIIIAGHAKPLREASGSDHYSSAKAAGGREEIVRFRLPTEDLIAAANSSGFTLAFGMVQIEINGASLADFREFASRLNPKR